LGGGPDYSVACGTKLPLGKESIDTAVLWTTLMHVPKIQQAEVLAEIWRVLRPGGQLVVFDNDMEGWSLTNGKFDVFKVIMEHFIHSWGVDPLLMRDLPAILSQSGFSAISPLSIHTLVPTLLFPTLLGGQRQRQRQRPLHPHSGANPSLSNSPRWTLQPPPMATG